LLDAVIFNLIIGNHDAHAKNFSLLYLSHRSVRLAPLYDRDFVKDSAINAPAPGCDSTCARAASLLPPLHPYSSRKWPAARFLVSACSGLDWLAGFPTACLALPLSLWIGGR
jgi:hypothetical protein